MATPPPPQTKMIRISQVAGRYLLFDLADVMHLRRTHGMCAILVGTNPQAPNQNVFAGLPLELLPEEAALLVRRGDAYIADDLRAHLEALTLPSGNGEDDEEQCRRRTFYLGAHRDQRAEMRSSLEEALAARSRAVEKAREAGAFTSGGKKKKVKGKVDMLEAKSAPLTAEDEVTGKVSASEAEPSGSDPLLNPFLDSRPPPSVDGGVSSRATGGRLAGPVYFTPSTSQGLIPEGCVDEAELKRQVQLLAPQACPLYAHLSSRGYFMTPGLRFGGKYSVYPGDPFRFHAHFIANSYGWDEEVELLDIVGTGRLAGAVKKGLLLGAEEPGEGAGQPDGRNVRTFCVEWAGI